MICIPMKSSGSYDRTTILSLNQRKLQGPLRRAELDSDHLSALPNVPNRPANHPASVPRPPQPAISRPQAASCRLRRMKSFPRKWAAATAPRSA